MAISIRGSAGAWVAANATTQTVTLPTHASGDMLLVRVGMKHATLPGNITCATAGWAKIGQFNNGTTASGNGSGDVCVAVFWKVAASASETNPVITYHASVAATPSCASPIVFQKGGGEAWIEPPIGDGGAIAAATSISATIQTHLAAQSGDMLVAFLVTNDNTTLTVPTFTQSGLTLDTVAEEPATALSSATSNDISADACYRLVTAGTSSAAAVVTATNSVADVGAAWTTRLRVVTEPAGTTIYPTDTASAVSGEPTLISAFTGTDENPLSEGGTWAKLNSSTTAAFQRLSNQVAPTTSGLHNAYYNGANFGPDVEAYATVAATGSTYFVVARAQDEGGSSTWDGYSFGWAASQFVLNRWDNGVNTVSLGTAAGSVTAGDKIAIVCRGPTIQGWHYTGGSWALLVSATDSTYPNAGKVGLYAQGSTALRFDDFYAGSGTPLFATDREAWTSRGAGVQTDVTNTATGPTAAIQVTDTAGGTVVDWFTRPLIAFTLGTAIRANVRALESNAAANAIVGVQIAQVAGDGTSPTVWGTTGGPTELGTSEAAASFLVTGSDLSITDGQRLRVRFYIDDASGVSMATAHTVTLYYAGTSGGASGDTYLTFTQTLTEFSAGITVTPTTAALVVTKYAPTVTATNHQLVTVPTAGGSSYPTAVLASSPVAYYRMGEASGSVLDSIGSAHGTTTGTVTRDATGLITADDGAISFAASAYVSGTLGAAIGNVFTLEAMVKMPASGTSTITFFSSKGSASNISIAVRRGGGQFDVRGYVYDGSTYDAVAVTAAAVVAAGGTYHIVWSRAGTSAASNKVYVNGVDGGGTPSITQAVVNTDTTFWIGGFEGTAETWVDVIDEVALYNTALSSGDVAAHYAAVTAAGGLVLSTYAPTIRQGIGVIPTTKALTLATFAPTVRTPILCTPTTKALTATKYAPTVSTPERVTPTTKALALAAFAPVVTATSAQSVTPTTAALLLGEQVPTVTATAHQLVTPTTSSLVLTAYAPTITAGADVAVVAGTATVTLTTYAPTVSAAQHVTVTPSTATLSDTQFAPTVTISNHQRVTPPTAVLTATRYAPSVRTPILATPTTKALVATRYAPTVQVPQRVTPTTKTLTTSSFAPVITNPQTYVPATAVLIATKYAPTVSVTSASTIVIPNAALATTRYAPTVTASDRQIATPPAAVITTTKFAPTISTPVRVTPTTKALTATKYAPTVTASSATGIVPGTRALTITRYAPSVSSTAHVTVIPSTKVVQLVTYAPAARVANRATPATKALALTTLAPTVTPTLNTLVRPNPNALTITEYGPALEISGHAAFTPTTAALVITTYPPTAEMHCNTPLPEFIYGFAIVAVGDTAGVGTAQGGATVTASEGGSTAVSMTGPSARVSIR